jgi:hypothetical protein
MGELLPFNAPQTSSVRLEADVIRPAEAGRCERGYELRENRAEEGGAREERAEERIAG